ncbi:MAG: HAD-IA family hydrolase [Anaerolineaceae bacterium]|nr:HAD-IA family hydrolase [Anaerolineaceae bacterium]
MSIKAFFFDLDGTLYDTDCGLLDAVNQRIDQWSLLNIRMQEDEVGSFRERMFRKYGGTLIGLTLEYGLDYYAALRFCHDLPVEKYVRPNPVLREILGQLQGRKYIFTTSYRFYAAQVLKNLNILDCFDGIIDAIDVFPYPKPFPQAFQTALRITAETDAGQCAFFDDQPGNAAAGHQAGFFSVQVGTHHQPDPLSDAHIGRIEELLTIAEITRK